MAFELYSTPLFNDANLVSYWRMEGNSTDSKGTNNGTDTAITYGASYGKFGQGATFNGTSSKIDVPLPVNLNNDFTIFLWVWSSAEISGWNWFIDFNDYGSAVSGAIVLTTNGFLVRWSFGNWFTEGLSDYGTTTQLSSSTWNNLVITRSSNNLRTYVNGVQIGSTTATTVSNCPTSGTMHFGRGPSTGDLYGGREDDIAIFSRALTATEISNLYGLFRNKYLAINQSIHRSNYY